RAAIRVLGCAAGILRSKTARRRDRRRHLILCHPLCLRPARDGAPAACQLCAAAVAVARERGGDRLHRAAPGAELWGAERDYARHRGRRAAPGGKRLTRWRLKTPSRQGVTELAYIVAGGTSQPVRFDSPPSLSKVWPRLGGLGLSGVTVTCLQV